MDEKMILLDIGLSLITFRLFQFTTEDKFLQRRTVLPHCVQQIFEKCNHVSQFLKHFILCIRSFQEKPDEVTLTLNTI
jgi:hypothetical protein